MSGDPVAIDGLEDFVVIGRGGFSTVFRASQPAFDRTVAVKVLAATDLDRLGRERFDRECRALGKLSEHPAIVTVFDAGFDRAGRPYLTMAYLADGSLGDLIRGADGLGWERAADLGVRLAGALQTAHDAGIVHRDIKPANVLMSPYGEPQLADFGIARIAGGHETSSGVVTASVLFAAPETVEGARPTAVSDQYSLAATVYALSAGEAPHERAASESLGALIRAVVTDDVAPIPRVPTDFAAAVMRGLSRDPADRFASVAEFGQALIGVQRSAGISPTPLLVGTTPTAHRAASRGTAETISIAETTRSAAGGRAQRQLADTLDSVEPVDLEVTSESVESNVAVRPPPEAVTSPPQRRGRRRALITVAVVAVVLAVGAAAFIGSDDASDDVVASDAGAVEPVEDAATSAPPGGPERAAVQSAWRELFGVSADVVAFDSMTNLAGWSGFGSVQSVPLEGILLAGADAQLFSRRGVGPGDGAMLVFESRFGSEWSHVGVERGAYETATFFSHGIWWAFRGGDGRPDLHQTDAGVEVPFRELNSALESDQTYAAWFAVSSDGSVTLSVTSWPDVSEAELLTETFTPSSSGEDWTIKLASVAGDLLVSSTFYLETDD